MADERIKIIVDGEDRASKPFAAVNKSLDSLDKGAVKAHSRLGELGGGILKLGAIATGAGVLALGALAGAAVSAATGFEQTISGIKAVSGATAQEAKEISSLALQLGKDTAFSAKEAAAGIEELIKGGLNIPDVMNGAAKSMLDLAAAGGVSIPDAAEIAANAMAMFNLKGDQMAHAADLIAGAANASSLSVTDFKFSMAASGAIAATTGQTFDDLAQAIAIMGKSGIKGSDAGTSLKTMLMNLQPTTKKAKETFAELGITMKDGTNQFIKADGSFKSMAEIAEVLQKATSKLTDAQKLQALETMFGSDAIRAAAIMAKEGATGFNEMAGAMGKVTAASVGAERLNNLAGSMEQLKGSLETAAIALGMALLPIIRKVVDAFTKLVNVAIPWIEEFGPRFVKLVEDITGSIGDLVTGGLGVFADDLREAFSVDITAFIAPLERVGDVLSSLVNTAKLLVTGDFEGGIFGLTEDAPFIAALFSVRDAVISIGTAFGNATQFVRDHKEVQAALVGIMVPLVALWTEMKIVAMAHAAILSIQTIATGALTAAQTALNVVMAMNPIGIIVLALVGLVAGFIYAYNTSEDFRNIVDGVWKSVTDFTQTAWTTIKYLMARLGATLTWLGLEWALLSASVSLVWETIKATIQNALNAVTGFLANAWAWITATASSFWDGFLGLVTKAWDIVAGIINAGIAVVEFILQVAWFVIYKVAKAFWDTFGGMITAAWTWISDRAHEVWDAVYNYLLGLWVNTQTMINNKLIDLKKIISTAWQWISDNAHAVWDPIYNYLLKLWVDTQVMINNKLIDVKKIINDAWTWVSDTTTKLWTAIFGTVDEKMKNTQAAVQGPLDAILGFFQSLDTEVRRIVGDLFDAVTRWFGDMLSGAMGKLGEIGSIIDRIKGMIGAMPSAPTLGRLATSGGDTFAGQSQDVQSSFIGSYGAAAADVWQAEHDAARGYQHGGSFVVGGQPGIDRNLVSMLLTKGERVDITPAGRGGAGRGINLTFNIYTTVADEPGLRRFARQIKSEIDAVVEGAW